MDTKVVNGETFYLIDGDLYYMHDLNAQLAANLGSCGYHVISLQKQLGLPQSRPYDVNMNTITTDQLISMLTTCKAKRESLQQQVNNLPQKASPKIGTPTTPQNNITMLIIGGIIILAVVGYLIFRKK